MNKPMRPLELLLLSFAGNMCSIHAKVLLSEHLLRAGGWHSPGRIAIAGVWIISSLIRQKKIKPTEEDFQSVHGIVADALLPWLCYLLLLAYEWLVR